MGLDTIKDWRLAHIAHFEDNVPNFSKHMELAIHSKLWVSDTPRVSGFKFVSLKKAVWGPLFFRKLWFWPILTQLTTPPWYISLESYKSQLSCCLAPTQLSWTCRASVFGKASAKLYPLSETLSYPLPIYFQYIPTVRLILIMIKSILPWEWRENEMLKCISNIFLTIG